MFYRGSNNVDMWGKWQDLEIVIPLLVSFFVSLLIISPIYLVWQLIRKKRKHKDEH